MELPIYDDVVKRVEEVIKIGKQLTFDYMTENDDKDSNEERSEK